MLSPQLLVSAIFGLIWAGLAFYLLVWYRGPEQLARLQLRTMGILAALFALYNGIRFYLEWRRLRRLRRANLHHDHTTASPPID
ncbi:hypothetical protein HRbin36_02853 [bacterium HR36]|nr:hypothetical protein HRbin36_02853 [bacterium HR36]